MMYSTKPTMIAATGGQGIWNSTPSLGPKNPQAPTTKPTAHEIQPAEIESRARTGPLETSQHVVGGHGTADRTEGSTNDAEHGSGIASLTGEHQADRSSRTDAARDERVHLRQRVLEAGGSNQRTEAGRWKRCDRQQQPEHFGNCSPMIASIKTSWFEDDFLAVHQSRTIGAGDNQQGETAGEDRCTGDADQTAQLDVSRSRGYSRQYRRPRLRPWRRSRQYWQSRTGTS